MHMARINAPGNSCGSLQIVSANYGSNVKALTEQETLSIVLHSSPDIVRSAAPPQ